jgi:hypothetical protein
MGSGRRGEQLMRVLGSSVLVLEWLVFALAIPVLINVSGVASGVAFTLLGVVTVLVVAAAKTLPSRTGIVIGWIVQAVALASGLILVPMLILGAIFTGLWLMAVQLGTAVDARKAESQSDSIDLTAGSTGSTESAEPLVAPEAFDTAERPDRAVVADSSVAAEGAAGSATQADTSS